MKRGLLLILTSAAFLAGGLAMLPTSEANSKTKQVTFSKDVAPIFNKSCAECHRPGEAAPFSTLTYKDVRPWAKSIKEKVAQR
jgi:mono/diheme cytochrome c family protein